MSLPNEHRHLGLREDYVLNFARLTPLFTVAAAVLFAAGGCSGSGMPSLATVSGIVTLNGAPYPNARVAFSPAQGRPSEGITDSTGKYELSYLPGVKGVEPGDHSVSITTQYQAPENPGSEPPFVEPLPPKYNVTSTLTAKVEKGSNQIDFTLTVP